MTKKIFVGLTMTQLLVLSSIVFPEVSSANAITYQVNDATVQSTVTGFITTDGKLGMIGTGDIVDWSLTITDPVHSLSLLSDGINSNMNCCSEGSTPLFATKSSLIFDYSAYPTEILNFHTNGQDIPGAM